MMTIRNQRLRSDRKENCMTLASPVSKHPPEQPVRLGWVLALASTAFFMVALDALVVITALPRIQQDLHVGLASLQWTVNSYNIAVAAGIISAAALGDRFGRRRLFVIGLVLFAVASAACALAPDVGLLIAARTLQGLGGAIVLPLSLTILMDAFPIERRATVLGVYGGLAGLAVAAGPLLGGAVAEGLDWHWIFWLNVPIGLVAATLCVRLLPEARGGASRIDLPGVALVTAGGIGLVWALTRASVAGWGSTEVIGTLTVGVVGVAAFAAWERRAAAPMLPLHFLRIRAFAAGNAAAFLLNASIFSGAFFVSQYFQFALGYSPLQAGLRLLPFFVTPMLVAPPAGALSARIGLRPVIVAGLVLQAVGFAWVALDASLRPSYPKIAVALLIAGVGVSMTLPTVPTAVVGAVQPAHMGTASGINSMMQRFGAVFGLAVTGAVFAAYGGLGSSASVADGFRPAVWVAAGLALLAALAALALTPRTAHAGEAAVSTAWSPV
jgi:EmrB/QacA subfamily drug resistance transporter